MPLLFERNDICKMAVDAIVNPADESLLGGGGLDECIHKAAGNGLLEECRTLGGCAVGQAKITGAYALPCRHIIHTVGPVWHEGSAAVRRQLRSCYESCLELAKRHGCESLAFPLISSGTKGCPKSESISIAVEAVSQFLLENDMTVYIVVFGRDAMELSSKLFSDIREYIDDNYAEQSHRKYARSARTFARYEAPVEKAAVFAAEDSCCCPMPMAIESSLEDAVKRLDESFSRMLLRKITESGMSDSKCYKKANIDRRLFSKIRSDVNYKPSKSTALAFAVALEMDMKDTEELLKKAGYALSNSSVFDVIVRYFIEKGNYNIYEINEALFAFDQSLLGG